MKIVQKLTLSFLLVAVFSVILVSTFIFTTTRTALHDEITSKIHLAVEEKEALLLSLLQTQLANLQYLAQEPEVVKLSGIMVNADNKYTKKQQQSAYRSLKKHLTNFADYYGGTYGDIMVADLKGHMWIGIYSPPDEGTNEADTEWFKKGSKDIYLGSISYNPAMLLTTQIAAMPIKNDKGVIIAVLQLETNVKAINNIMKHRIGLGKTGEIYIVDQDKRMLTKSRFYPDARGSLKVNTFGINQTIETKTDLTTTPYKNYRGREVLGSVHFLGVSQTIEDKKTRALIKELGWLFVGEIEADEAFAPITKLRNKLLATGVGIISVVLVISFIVSRSFSVPIIKLRDASIETGTKYLYKKVDFQSNDELGELATAYNNMMQTLKDTTVSKDYVENIIRSMIGTLIVTDPDGRIERVNQALIDMLGYSREELIGMPVQTIFYGVKRPDNAYELKTLFYIGVVEKNYIKKDGSEIPVIISCSSLSEKTPDTGGLIFFAIDISDRKIAEKQIMDSLHEKEVLLREIHHRVKNNLQIVSSLLNFQVEHTGGKSIEEVFNECKHRIRSISLIHEMLYQSTDIGSINFKKYINELASALFHAYNIDINIIKRTENIEDIPVDIDSAIQLGLISCELISNSLKYAFPDARPGELTIEYYTNESGSHTFIVRDDGVGIPKDFDVKTSDSLGLHLVDLLTRQLGGKLEITGDDGAEFKIELPI